MIKKYKWQLVLSSIIIFLPIVIGFILWNYFPEQIVTNWKSDGKSNEWTGRSFVIFGIPIILFITHWICIFITILDSKNATQSRKVFHIIFWILPITSVLLCGMIYITALGKDIHTSMMVRMLLGIMFLLFGNYMPKCKQNHTIGIKVIWTLRNTENWNKTHRFTGKLWVFGGIILLVTMFLSSEKLMYAFLPLIFIMAFAPIIFSYVYYRRQLKDESALKEEIKMTPSEKKATNISIAAGIIIVACAMVFLLTGRFEVTFGEEAFTIDAAYWDDATVFYTAIDDMEYRETDDPSAASNRKFGYGSFHLLMGEFENSEFGSYTRYSYTSCSSCIVLTVDEKILVINGKNDEQTKAIYNELIKKISK